MKKYFAAFILSLILVANVGSAATKDNVCGAYVQNSVAALFPTHFCGASDAIVAVVKFMLALIAMVAVGVIVLGGYKYVTSQGNAEAATAGRKAVTNAIIGLVIAVLAYSIVAVVSNTLGSVNTTGGNSTGSSSGTGGSTVTSQDAAIKHLISNTKVFITDPTGATPFVTFTVKVNIAQQDVQAVCPNADGSSKVSATITVPFSDGSVKQYSSADYEVGPDGGGYVQMGGPGGSFDSSKDPFLKSIEPDADILTNVHYTTGDGCHIDYQLTGKPGSFGPI